MPHDAIGAAFAIVAGLAVGVSHLTAARHPERNAVTRLIRVLYEYPWPLLRSLSARHAILLVGIGGFVAALAALASLLYALLR